MSRIRTVKPEFWKDEKIGRLSPRARLLFIATWNFADDMGTCRGSPGYLRGEAFPYDDILLADVVGALRELEREELVRSFVDQGQTYLSIHHWARHQKINNPSGAKYPDPPRNLWDSRRTTVGLTESYHEEGKGREGKGAEPESESARARERELTQDSMSTTDAPVIPLNTKASRT